MAWPRPMDHTAEGWKPSPSRLYVKRDTMRPEFWRLAWMVPGASTYCMAEGECSAVYHRTRWQAVAYGERHYGERALNWPRRD